MAIQPATLRSSSGADSAPVVVDRVQRRVLTRLDPWSVFRTSVALYAAVLLVVIIAGTFLWIGGSTVGLVDNTEDVIAELFALERFAFRPFVILRSLGLIGVLGIVVGAGINAVVAVFYNLIAEAFGGVEITLVDEQVVRRPRV